jgi:arylsulfate sulfotransferase
MRNQSWILKIDYQNGMGTGDILWRLGAEGDFTLAQGVAADWFYAQHYPFPLSDDGSQTTLAVWDNGDDRIDSDNKPCGISPCYSRATIFQIDQGTKVADLIWQYLPGFYSFWGGSIEKVDNGDVEFDQTIPFGSAASRIQEVTNTDSPRTVWQLDLSGENVYRGYRIPSLYPGVTWK